MEDLTNIKITMEGFRKDLEFIKEALQKNSEDHHSIAMKIDNFMVDTENKFVLKNEFKPVRIIVYGMVGFILVSFLSAVVGFVLLQ